MPPDPDRYRRTMSRFATGVTVVAAEAGGEIHGMTANAVASLSLDPPLLLVAVDRRARLNRFLRASGAFAVNILRDVQEPLARYFSGETLDPPAFRFGRWAGVPRLRGALGAIACRLDRIVDGGDHWIVVGRVEAVWDGPPPHRPLLFFGRRYRRLVARPGRRG